MAQTGYSPILLYSSSTASAAPLAGNLTNSTTGSELGINITDGKLFYKDNSGVVQVIGWKTVPTTAGGTGLTSYTAGDLPYFATGTTFSKLGIGTSGYVLQSNGSAPTWVAQSTLSVGTATNATNTAITDNTSSSATWYPTIVSATTGNLPQTTSSTKLSFVPSTGVLSANGVALTGNLGTVTSVSALTLGTTGTDLSSTVATGTTTPVITLNVPTASATNRGALSAADWTTFNGKQAALVSGTNIKTVGGVSLLGSGDVGTIGTGYGGTGTATTFTSGSVLFTTTSGVYSQDNANFFYDPSHQFLGVQTSAPQSPLYIGSGNEAIGEATYRGWITLNQYNSTLSAAQGIEFKVRADSNGYGWRMSAWNSGSSTDLSFVTRQATATWTETTRFWGSGGVSIGNTTDPGAGGLRISGLIYPQQAATASAPSYVKGAIYFDTTLNKLRVGGATAWETITSV